MIENEIARIRSELADIGCLLTCGKTCEEKISEIFEKSLDKTHQACYNENVPRGRASQDLKKLLQKKFKKLLTSR